LPPSKKKPPAACASCTVARGERICITEKGQAGSGCPTLTRNDTVARANQEYAKGPVREFARQASIQEAECYANRHQRPYIMQPCKPRIVEIGEFARKMGYKKLGLAFCIGLSEEARLVEEVFRAWYFDVVSVVCKAGRTPKSLLGLTSEETIRQDAEEAMCNPVLQARVLNEEATDLNVLLGLCVGHDSLFFRYAEAPTTVLAAKDRVTGHNPLAAVYLSESYFTRVRHPGL
jgi:uncharacterized metal-binding protein